MFSNKGLQFAFFLSVLIHGVVFLGTGLSRDILQRKKTDVEIIYYQSEDFMSPDVKEMPHPETAPVPVKTPVTFSEVIEKEKDQAKKSVQINQRETRESSKKAGVDYYDVVREKIRRSVEYPSRAAEGDIFLSFILSRDGQLKSEPRILDKSSTEIPALREAARRGIIAASPFPSLPDSILGGQITFNIVVSFRSRD